MVPVKSPTLNNSLLEEAIRCFSLHSIVTTKFVLLITRLRTRLFWIKGLAVVVPINCLLLCSRREMFTFFFFKRLGEVTSHSFHVGGWNPHFNFCARTFTFISWIED
jgi:hypothetical protein